MIYDSMQTSLSHKIRIRKTCQLSKDFSSTWFRA